MYSGEKRSGNNVEGETGNGNTYNQVFLKAVILKQKINWEFDFVRGRQVSGDLEGETVKYRPQTGANNISECRSS